LAGDFGGFAEAHDAATFFRAGAEATLVMSAVQQLAQSRSATDVQRANSFGGVEFVAGK